MQNQPNPQQVRLYGVAAIIIGILFTWLAFWLMDQLGRMLIIVLAIGPIAILIGFYQLITGKMLKNDQEQNPDSSEAKSTDQKAE